MQIWKKLIYRGVDYSDRFEISNEGQLRNINNQHVYKTSKRNGYEAVCVSYGSRSKKLLIKIHKAVAEMFVQNINNKSIVNHIDGNKLNNSFKNLEWCTNQENTTHAFKMRINHSFKRRKTL